MKFENVWNDSEDLKGAVWEWGGSYRCHGAGGSPTRYAEEVGIHIDKRTFKPSAPTCLTYRKRWENL